MSRRQRATVAMLVEDHWCWAPLVGYGMVPPPEVGEIPRMVEDPEAGAESSKGHGPRLQHGGVRLASSPARSPAPILNRTLVLVYCNTAQARTMLMAVKYKEGRLVASEFDPIDSCVFSTRTRLCSRMADTELTLPDPGEFQRAMASEDEIIFSVPQREGRRRRVGPEADGEDRPGVHALRTGHAP